MHRYFACFVLLMTTMVALPPRRRASGAAEIDAAEVEQALHILHKLERGAPDGDADWSAVSCHCKSFGRQLSGGVS
jgi:hypothetical protein